MRTLFLLRGAPGAGKSTWIANNNLGAYTLSTDNIRLMCESPATTIEGEKAISQKNDGFVWEFLFKLLETRMENGEFVIIDATHYKAPLINQYNDLVDKYRYRVYVVDFSQISVEELHKRNEARGFRKIPKETINKMVVALADRSEIKSAYKLISPDEALEIINKPLEPVEVDKDKVVIFGDIHGCLEPLKEYFDKNPFDENNCYIFCGDYIDRGIQNKEVLEFLFTIYKNKNVILLEGNHEKWLRIYASKDYDISNYLGVKKVKYKDIYITKIISEYSFRVYRLKRDIKSIETEIEYIKALDRKEKENGNNSSEIYFEFEKVKTEDILNKKAQEKKSLEDKIELINNEISKLKKAEGDAANVINSACDKYFEIFNEKFNFDIRKALSVEYDLSINKSENEIRSKEFMDYTYNEIKDLDKSELRQLCRKFAQLSYFRFNNKLYLVTHSGVPIMPNITMASNEIIKGVGKYEDSREVDKSFVEKCKNEGLSVISIHGHRNIFGDEAKMNDGMTYNLEGQIEHGGYLRILTIDKDGENVLQIKNNTYSDRFAVEEKIEPKIDGIDLLKKMTKSPLISVKSLKNDVLSLNFTREAFYDKKWNDLTCKARGLFVNKKNGDVVARSFTKFFNYNEVEETKDESLQLNFKYPIVAYKKENGFLGIISKYKGEVYIFTKSSDEGDFVDWFKAILSRKFSTDYKEYLRDKLMDGYSYIFECIDPVNDPHIIYYPEKHIVLLEVMENDLVEKHVPYDELCKIGKELDVQVKEKTHTFNSWEEFYKFKTDFSDAGFNFREEGYVIEDANGFRLKLKSKFYSFWKQMRTVKEQIQKGAGNKKVYITKEEIEVVKVMEKIDREKLKAMSIIDVEKMMGY